MISSRKVTAWKKNRKFGDVFGGRTFPKLPDKIFNRLHSLNPPVKNQEVPITITENPSRDFFFPITPEDILTEFKNLPPEHTDDITHIWFRRISKKDFQKKDFSQAAFICGSKVRVIIFHPFPKDLRINFGKKKPSDKIKRFYGKWSPELNFSNDNWYLQWTEPEIKKYYLEHLLLHEIGHHLDWYRHEWSKANHKQVEDAANNYAFLRAKNVKE